MNRSAILILAFAPAVSVASDWRPLETHDQARERQSAENYQRYEQQENRLLPPSYQQPLGSPTVYGAERPGYAPPPVYHAPQPSYGGSWQDRAKGR